MHPRMRDLVVAALLATGLAITLPASRIALEARTVEPAQQPPVLPQPVPTEPTPIQKPVAPPPPDIGPLQPQPPGEPRRFTGHPVSLDFQGADLRAVLRTFAEISGLNIVLDSGIPACSASGVGCVDLTLKDVPWDQALEIILRSNKLGYAVDGTIVRIAPLSVLADEEGERRKLFEAQALAGELQVLTRALSYAKAQELVPILTRSALSQRGDVQVDQRTNTLVIRDLEDRLTAAGDLIDTLDKPERQVEIEARIVRVRRDYSREIGVLWGVNGRVSPDLGNTTNLAFPNSGSVSGRTGGTQGPGANDTAVNLPTQNAPTGAIGLALGSVNGAFQLDVALQALEDQGKLRLLSSPRVSTQNNIEAEITQGTQIPLQTVANNTVSVSFKDAALTLRVTPQITASDTVILRISLEKAQADFSRSINGIPPIDTQRAVTNVLLANGETTVIGGIFESQEVTGQASVPLLSRIPILGWLFKNSAQSEFQDELMIFITPRILKS
jgi:type IV pilus assembly protein PilQ